MSRLGARPPRNLVLIPGRQNNCLFHDVMNDSGVKTTPYSVGNGEHFPCVNRSEHEANH
jgi:hypothetical protein